MSIFKERLEEAERILDNTPVALYIEPAKTLEQQIWFLKEIKELPYPVRWFEMDEKRTRAMYKKHYSDWQKEFVKAHVAYMKAKQNWEYYLKQYTTEMEEMFVC